MILKSDLIFNNIVNTTIIVYNYGKKYWRNCLMKIFKKWWFWVIVGIVVIGAIGSNGNKENNSTTQQAAAVSSQAPQVSEAPKTSEAPKATEAPKQVATPKPVTNKPTISKAEFDKIENGMTYEQVTQIIGGPGEVLSEVGQKGDQFYTIMYSYTGEGQLGANANFTFQGGKLQAKAQMGLK
jgi:hypothetical protein